MSGLAAVTKLLPVKRVGALAKTALLVSVGAYVTGRRLDHDVASSVVLATGLWAVLYALNEASDLVYEQKKRLPRVLFVALYLAVVAVVVFSVRENTTFGLLILTMSVSQIVYCVGPRLKKFWFWALLLSGVVNPILRILAGALVVSDSVLQILPLVIVVHLTGAMTTRLKNRKKDIVHNYEPIPERYWAARPSLQLVSLTLVCQAIASGLLPMSFASLVAVAVIFELLMRWLKGGESREGGETARVAGWIIFASVAPSVIFDIATRMP